MAAVVDDRRHGAKWDYREGVAATDAERELYERARNAASEAEGEGDAQFRAAVAAAQAPVGSNSPTRLSSCSLRFQSDQLEAAYRRKAATNSDFHDYVPILLKTALHVPSLLLVLDWLSHLLFQGNCSSRSQPREFTSHELLSVCVGLTCILTLGIQLIWPQWYKSHRGTTLQYLIMFVWVWESAKLLVNTNDSTNVLVEVCFLNTFVSVLHRVPFSLHCQLRSYGGVIQAAAIICKAVAVNARLEILGLALAGHAVGLGLAYELDRRSRQRFLRSLPSWLLDDLARMGRNGAGRSLSYRASLASQMWSIFYPEPGSENPPACAQGGGAARRALGGFAGGFGGVSSLNCARPRCSNLSPPSSSSSVSGRESSGSSGSSSDDDWGDVGQTTSSGVSFGEMMVGEAAAAAAPHDDVPDTCTSATVDCAWTATGSACSHSGMEPSSSPYRVPARAVYQGIRKANRW